MARSVDVQDERHDAVPWMARSVDVQASLNPEPVEGRQAQDWSVPV
ncbi:hypothetical protein [Thalassotalea fusca]